MKPAPYPLNVLIRAGNLISGIYAVVEPWIDDPIKRVRYVGSSKNIARRKRQHELGEPSPIRRRLELIALRNSAGELQVLLLEKAPEHQLKDLEKKWRRFYHDQGADLLNEEI